MGRIKQIWERLLGLKPLRDAFRQEEERHRELRRGIEQRKARVSDELRDSTVEETQWLMRKA